jgi:hypothetical protein
MQDHNPAGRPRLNFGVTDRHPILSKCIGGSGPHGSKDGADRPGRSIFTYLVR